MFYLVPILFDSRIPNGGSWSLWTLDSGRDPDFLSPPSIMTLEVSRSQRPLSEVCRRYEVLLDWRWDVTALPLALSTCGVGERWWRSVEVGNCPMVELRCPVLLGKLRERPPLWSSVSPPTPPPLFKVPCLSWVGVVSIEFTQSRLTPNDRRVPYEPWWVSRCDIWE